MSEASLTIVAGVDIAGLSPRMQERLATANPPIEINLASRSQENYWARDVARRLLGLDPWPDAELATAPDPRPTVAGFPDLQNHLGADAAVQRGAWAIFQEKFQQAFGHRFAVEHQALLEEIFADAALVVLLSLGDNPDQAQRARLQVESQLADIVAYDQAKLTQVLWASFWEYLRKGAGWLALAAGATV